MPSSNAFDSQLDEALGGILSQGWDEPAPVPAEPPTKDSLQWMVDVIDSIEVKAPAPEPAQAVAYAPLDSRTGEVPHLPLPAPRSAAQNLPVAHDEEADRGHLNIGLLTDLATGRKTAEEAAAFAGVTTDDLHDMFAVTLRELPPAEIAKAMGLQAAEQQLKSGAIYGAVLADLVGDMVAGRLKPETKIELAKMLAKVGRVEPKDDKSGAAGGGFVLNISLGNAPVATAVTIDAD